MEWKTGRWQPSCQLSRPFRKKWVLLKSNKNAQQRCTLGMLSTRSTLKLTFPRKMQEGNIACIPELTQNSNTHTASSCIACNRFRRAVRISTGCAIVFGNLRNLINLCLCPSATRPAAHGSRNGRKCTSAVDSWESREMFECRILFDVKWNSHNLDSVAGHQCAHLSAHPNLVSDFNAAHSWQKKIS